MPGPTQVSARLALPFVGEISGVWEPADAERRASWELYLELASRVSVVELDPEEGLLREALSSLYSLSAPPVTSSAARARKSHRRSGPAM
ncbi:hypothetical protein [Streptomyces axinellae]|uniref:Uncharacterized protein n=1 Tax=Streptomyces axinellae TaxID=552788 RepID=A0ABN3QKU7_9ACTN